MLDNSLDDILYVIVQSSRARETSPIPLQKEVLCCSPTK